MHAEDAAGPGALIGGRAGVRVVGADLRQINAGARRFDSMDRHRPTAAGRNMRLTDAREWIRMAWRLENAAREAQRAGLTDAADRLRQGADGIRDRLRKELRAQQ